VQEQTVIANFPTADKPAYVYFVRIGKFIKIGFTTNLRGRLKSFRGASAEPIEVLLIIAGGRELEQRLHALFCEDRISNEFFRHEFLLNEFIHGGKDDVAAALDYVDRGDARAIERQQSEGCLLQSKDRFRNATIRKSWRKGSGFETKLRENMNVAQKSEKGRAGGNPAQPSKT
jgi:Meiotically Up-regulated Gene 113 (MUG113) protein